MGETAPQAEGCREGARRIRIVGKRPETSAARPASERTITLGRKATAQTITSAQDEGDETSALETRATGPLRSSDTSDVAAFDEANSSRRCRPRPISSTPRRPRRCGQFSVL